MSRCCLLVVLVLIFQVVFLTNIQCVPVEQEVVLSDAKIAHIKEMAESLKDSLSSTMDPCNDFQGYVCEKADVNGSSYPDFEEMGKHIEKYLLENDLTETERKLKDFLTSCKRATNDDIKHFVKEFNFESIGEWPAFNSDWKGDKFDWQIAVAELHTYYLHVIISGTFNFREKKDLGTYLTINVQDNRSMLFENENRKKGIREKLSQFNVNNVDEVINDAVGFEETCKKVLTASQLSEENEIETDVTGLQKEIPEIDWDKQIEIITGKKLEGNFPVVLKNKEALKGVIAAVSKMKPKTIANYIFCYFVESILPVKEFRSCYGEAVEYFSPVISGIFIKTYLKGNEKSVLTDMLHIGMKNLHKYLGIFNERLVDNIPAPEELINEDYFSRFSDDNLNKQYRDIEVDDDKFFRNTFYLTQRNNLRDSNILSDSNLDTTQLLRLLLDPMSLSSSFKIKNQPSSFIFRDMVFVFLSDYADAILDINKATSLVKDCLEQQNNSPKTKDVFSAPFAILQILAEAYFEWEDQNSDISQAENQILKEYGLNNKKVFFTSVAQFTCGDILPSPDGHMNTFLRNMHEFADEYNCPVGSFMNPKEKCNIEKFL